MSNKVKYTPGPWEASPNTFETFEITSKDLIIGEVLAQGEYTEEGEANAKLIAAAPELLEALKTFRTYFEKDGQVTGALWSIANDAIKKATE